MWSASDARATYAHGRRVTTPLRADEEPDCKPNGGRVGPCRGNTVEAGAGGAGVPAHDLRRAAAGARKEQGARGTEIRCEHPATLRGRQLRLAPNVKACEEFPRSSCAGKRLSTGRPRS